VTGATLTCAEAKDRLVDYLYGALAANDRAAFEAHSSACEACRGEADAIQRTLGQARAVMRGDLDQAPPVRVRSVVMQAAAQAVQARPQGEDPGGWKAWLRRPWFIPMFAAACTMMFFVLTREVVTDPKLVARHFEAQAPVAARQAKNEIARAPEEPPFEPPPAAPASGAAASVAEGRRVVVAKEGVLRGLRLGDEMTVAPIDRDARRSRPMLAKAKVSVSGDPVEELNSKDLEAAKKTVDGRFAPPPPPDRKADRLAENDRLDDLLQSSLDGRSEVSGRGEGAGAPSGTGARAGAPSEVGAPAGGSVGYPGRSASAGSSARRKPSAGAAGPASERERVSQRFAPSPPAEAALATAEPAPAKPSPEPAQAQTKGYAQAPAPARTMIQTPAAPSKMAPVLAPPSPTTAQAPSAVRLPTDLPVQSAGLPVQSKGAQLAREARQKLALAKSKQAESEPAFDKAGEKVVATAPSMQRRAQRYEDAPVDRLDRADQLALLPLDDLIRRAERAFSERRWADATALYRELVRRFPEHDSVALWRTRLRSTDQASQATKEQRPTKQQQAK